MPGIDGPSALKRMRENAATATIPVIFMTAKVLPQEVAHLLQLGAIGVIAKPFDPLTLCDEISVLWKQVDMALVPSERRELSMARVRAEVTSLTSSFLERTRADVLRLRDMIDRAHHGERCVLEDIERVAHSIHGSGAMFGFAQVSAAGAVIERLIQGLMANTATPGLAGELGVLQQLWNHAERLAREVESAAHATPGSVGMFQGAAMADKTKSWLQPAPQILEIL
jgi:CheY-like chemotaxis protein